MVRISITVTDKYPIKIEKKHIKISVRQGAIFRKSLNLRPVRIMASTVVPWGH